MPVHVYVPSICLRIQNIIELDPRMSRDNAVANTLTRDNESFPFSFFAFRYAHCAKQWCVMPHAAGPTIEDFFPPAKASEARKHFYQMIHSISRVTQLRATHRIDENFSNFDRRHKPTRSLMSSRWVTKQKRKRTEATNPRHTEIPWHPQNAHIRLDDTHKSNDKFHVEKPKMKRRTAIH